MRFYKKNTYYVKSRPMGQDSYILEYKYDYEVKMWSYYITRVTGYTKGLSSYTKTKSMTKELEYYKEELITEEEYEKLKVLYELSL